MTTGLPQPVTDEPSPPCNLRVTDYWSDYITIAWDTPRDDGGSPITGFIVEKRDTSRQTWVKAGCVGSEVTTLKIGNLFEGVDYHFRLFAENKAGLSATALETEKPVTAKMPFGKLIIVYELAGYPLWGNHQCVRFL